MLLMCVCVCYKKTSTYSTHVYTRVQCKKILNIKSTEQRGPPPGAGSGAILLRARRNCHSKRITFGGPLRIDQSDFAVMNYEEVR